MEVTYLVFKVVSGPPHSRGDLVVMMCGVVEAQHIPSSAEPNNKSDQVEVRKQRLDFLLEIKQKNETKQKWPDIAFAVGGCWRSLRPHLIIIPGGCQGTLTTGTHAIISWQ